MYHVQEWLLSLAGLFSYLPCLNFIGGKLVHSITLIPFEFVIIFGRHVYQVKTLCHVHEWLLSLAGLLSYHP